MKNTFFAALVCGLFLALSHNTTAQAAGDPNALIYFVGDWHCGVKDADGVLDPNGFSTASTEQLRGGWFATWVLAFHDGTSDKMLASMRYDAVRKHYVLFLKDDHGGYGMGVANDWQQNALAFKGTFHAADGNDLEFTKTFTVLTDGSFSLGWQVEGEAAQPSIICEK